MMLFPPFARPAGAVETITIQWKKKRQKEKREINGEKWQRREKIEKMKVTKRKEEREKKMKKEREKRKKND